MAFSILGVSVSGGFMKFKEFQVFETGSDCIEYIIVSFLMYSSDNLDLVREAARVANCCIMTNDVEVGMARDGIIFPMEKLAVDIYFKGNVKSTLNPEWMKDGSFRKHLEMAERVSSHVLLVDEVATTPTVISNSLSL